MTTRTPLDPDRLRKLCGMFGSHHVGERANAARTADALVRQHGLTWGEVIRVPALAPDDWRAAARFCAEHQQQLSPREIYFIIGLARWRGQPTCKQLKWLNHIVTRLRGEQ